MPERNRYPSFYVSGGRWYLEENANRSYPISSEMCESMRKVARFCRCGDCTCCRFAAVSPKAWDGSDPSTAAERTSASPIITGR